MSNLIYLDDYRIFNLSDAETLALFLEIAKMSLANHNRYTINNNLYKSIYIYFVGKDKCNMN